MCRSQEVHRVLDCPKDVDDWCVVRNDRADRREPTGIMDLQSHMA